MTAIKGGKEKLGKPSLLHLAIIIDVCEQWKALLSGHTTPQV